MRVLKLDASFRPVEVISWENAFYLLFKDRAQIIEEYEDKTVRSVSREFKVPSVIKVHMFLDKHKEARFCKENVFIRDNYTCQYCGTFGQETELTFDHITPRSKGGKTSWMNIVTACGVCNRKKADKFLEETKMKLINLPCIPAWSPRASIKMKTGDPECWRNYLKY